MGMSDACCICGKPADAKKCTDLDGWSDGDGTTCTKYAQNGYCINGKPKASMDWSQACTQHGGGFGPCQDRNGILMTEACCVCGRTPDAERLAGPAPRPLSRKR